MRKRLFAILIAVLFLLPSFAFAEEQEREVLTSAYLSDRYPISTTSFLKVEADAVIEEMNDTFLAIVTPQVLSEIDLKCGELVFQTFGQGNEYKCALYEDGNELPIYLELTQDQGKIEKITYMAVLDPNDKDAFKNQMIFHSVKTGIINIATPETSLMEDPLKSLLNDSVIQMFTTDLFRNEQTINGITYEVGHMKDNAGTTMVFLMIFPEKA